MVITIPWIIEFLNGIDGTSILLPCYKKLLAKLQYILYKIKLPTVNEFLDEIFLIYSEDVGKLLENAHIRLDNKNKISVRKIKNLAAQSDNDFCIRFARECIQTVNCSQILITLYVNSLFNNVSVFTIIQMEGIRLKIIFKILFFIIIKIHITFKKYFCRYFFIKKMSDVNEQ